MRCPCRKVGEDVTYAQCCQPYHSGLRPAPTAEALMRSRYTAYAMRDAAYISKTWHPSTRPATMHLPAGQEWLRLRVIAAHEQGERATVEFVARSRLAGAGHQQELHEISRFVRELGRWLYVDGLIK